MEFQVVIPVLISFAISVVLGPVIIPFLRRLKMGQTERTEGVQSHLKKAGTPTMGGVIFLIATAITALFYVGDYPKIIPVLFLTLGFGIIGFLDDYLKVVLKRSDGLLPWQKFLLQVVLTAIFVFYIVKWGHKNMPRKSYSIEERQRVKEALMTTVLQCIIDRGLIHSSIDILCRKVGISKTFFYTFFSSKEELVMAVIN